MGQSIDPRPVPREPPGVASMESPSIDLTRQMDLAFRLLCLAILMVVLCIGVYYGIEVFWRIGSLLKDPNQASAAVDSVAKLIDADKVTLELPQGPPVEPGRMLSLMILGLGYFVWAWIPLQIMGIAGRVILTMTSAARKDRAGN